MTLLGNLFSSAGVMSILIGMAVFAIVLFMGSMAAERDNLKARMKAVAGERENLRNQSRQPEGAKLRNQETSIIASLSELFNLERFTRSTIRDKLKQAGLRKENQVYGFVLARLGLGPILGLVAAVYSSLIIADLTTRGWLLIILASIVGGYMLPDILLKNMIDKRLKSIRRSWPEALDILLICVESGMGLEPALARVAREIGTQSVPLAEELTLACAELSYLPDRRKAYENLAKRVPLPMVKSVVVAFIQSERYGTPLGQALRVLAAETRDSRMQEAERQAAALGSKLTVPMILFFLPVVFVAILSPSIIRIMTMPSITN